MSALSDFILTRKKVLHYATLLFFFVIAICLCPISFLDSKEKLNNPEGCAYYIGLQSKLANYRQLASDKANATYIKNRISQFEKDVEKAKNKGVALGYKNSYYKKLKHFSVQSVDSVNNKAQIIAIAQQVAPIIDNYYFDERVTCTQPLYKWNSEHSRRILNFNFGGLYQHIPDKYARILSATPDGAQLGVFSGFFVNNQSTTLVTQFMTGLPLLTALYVMPQYDYAKMGNYFASVPWCYFSIRNVMDPTLRKITNITGFDIFTVTRKELGSKKIVGTIPLKTDIYRINGAEELMPFINTQSYGMAYLANQVYYADNTKIQAHEKFIRKYFAHSHDHDTLTFVATINTLYKNLTALKHKHDIILEAPDKDVTANAHISAGNVITHGIVGPRAVYTTNCMRDKCIAVVNIAASPGWQAYVNGSSTKIFRANYAFIAMAVPKGKSTVWLIYNPLSQLISYLLSILVLIGILISSYSEKIYQD